LVPALLVGVLAFPKSYVLISPGSARGVDSLISVAPDHSYEPSGDFFLLSVSVAQTRFLGEALSGWVDDDVDVHETEEVFGTASPQEYREQNVAAMSDSKQVAMYVALRRLGYEVTENGDGVFVNDIDPTVPAAEVLRQGDVVVEADGTKTLLMGDLVDVIEAHKPGDLLTLRVRRQGAERDVSAKLVEREGRTILGVLIETANQSFNYPFEVSIDSENIGGPSAGLAFTLGLIDRLTDGELAGGAEVAVTGTIQPDGSVGLVGGIRQKALAARRAGAEIRRGERCARRPPALGDGRRGGAGARRRRARFSGRRRSGGGPRGRFPPVSRRAVFLSRLPRRRAGGREVGEVGGGGRGGLRAAARPRPSRAGRGEIP
jgi:PDZ domain-containing protein